MNLYSDVNKCRCCGSSVVPYLFLGMQPLANSYIRWPSTSEFKAPLTVCLCDKCYHSQLSIVVNPLVMFRDYLYVSGTTETFRTHTKEMAKEAFEFWGGNFSTKPKVLDIACNDGTLLEHFRNLGATVAGVDPALNIRRITREKDIEVSTEFWNEKLAAMWADSGISYDIITAQNVFAHVADAKGFLQGVRHVLSKNGLAVIEFPYAVELVENNQFDTVYHEHLSYFLVNSFKTVADSVGLKIVKIVQTPIHGGSIRFYLSKEENREETPDVVRLIAVEHEKGLFDRATYDNMANRVSLNKTKFRETLKHMQEEKRTIVGYAASAKGNTMLNYFDVKFDYIVDDNKLKHGFLTPGKQIVIRSPDVLQESEEPMVLVVLAWNFFEEIKKRVASLTKRPIKYLLYVPYVRIEE